MLSHRSAFVVGQRKVLAQNSPMLYMKKDPASIHRKAIYPARTPFQPTTAQPSSTQTRIKREHRPAGSDWKPASSSGLMCLAAYQCPVSWTLSARITGWIPWESLSSMRSVTSSFLRTHMSLMLDSLPEILEQ